MTHSSVVVGRNGVVGLGSFKTSPGGQEIVVSHFKHVLVVGMRVQPGTNDDARGVDILQETSLQHTMNHKLVARAQGDEGTLQSNSRRDSPAPTYPQQIPCCAWLDAKTANFCSSWNDAMQSV